VSAADPAGRTVVMKGLAIMPRAGSKLIAVLAILTGSYLSLAELVGWHGDGQSVNLFWLGIGVVVILLGALELASRRA
jgi:hypothetical protein